MTIRQMKDIIAAVYPGEDWSTKVEDMSDQQVVAVYNGFARRGILNGLPKKKEPRGLERVTEINEEFDIDRFDHLVEQLSIFDI